MRKSTLCLLLVFGILAVQAQTYIPPDFYGESYTESYGFWPNEGQVIDSYGDLRSDISYVSDGTLPKLFMRRETQMSFVFGKSSNDSLSLDSIFRIDMTLVGEGVQNVDPTVHIIRDVTRNFYFPWCMPNGVTGVNPYSRTIYENVYPYIDMHFYCTGRGQKMSFVVRPGGNPDDLLMQFEGQDSLGVDITGALKIYAMQRYIRLEEAKAYQVGPFQNIIPVSWGANYENVHGSSIVGLNFGSYDESLPLIFQVGPPPALGGVPETPGVCWSTLFGGNVDDIMNGSDIDDNDNYYVAGNTSSAFNYFPTGIGLNLSQQGAADIATISRFNENDALIWTTFCSGGGQRNYAQSCAVTSGSNPFVYTVGYSAGGYPAIPNGTAYYDSSGYSGGFISKFLSLNGTLTWSTNFGHGTGSQVQNCTIDELGRLIVVGYTFDDTLPSHQVPLPPNASVWPYSGGQDGFVALFTTADEILWSTHVGGSNNDAMHTVKSHGNKIVIGGHTSSPNVQLLDPGNSAYYDSTWNGSNDVFLLEFDSSGVHQWSTYWGGSSNDILGLQGLDLDPEKGDILIVGTTISQDLPLLVAGQYNDSIPAYNNGYIARFSGIDHSQKWTTYFGLSQGDATLLAAVLFQDDGQFFIGGSAKNNSWPFVAQQGL